MRAARASRSAFAGLELSEEGSGGAEGTPRARPHRYAVGGRGGAAGERTEEEEEEEEGGLS